MPNCLCSKDAGYICAPRPSLPSFCLQIVTDALTVDRPVWEYTRWNRFSLALSVWLILGDLMFLCSIKTARVFRHNQQQIELYRA